MVQYLADWGVLGHRVSNTIATLLVSPLKGLVKAILSTRKL